MIFSFFKDAYCNSNSRTIFNVDDILDALDKATEQILSNISEWLSEGSGWRIELITEHFINIFRYIPLRGNSYIPLPEESQNSKKGLISIKITMISVFVGAISVISELQHNTDNFSNN